MNDTALIRKTPLFQNADDAMLDLVASCAHKKSYEKGQRVFSVGDEAHSLYLAASGWVKLYRTTRDGGEAVINVFGPGESFGEAAVFNNNKCYPAHAQAIEDSVLFEIPRSFFIQEIEKDSRFALRMLGAIAARQHFLVQQLEQVATRSAPQRIGAFLLRFCRKQAPEKNHPWVVDLPYDKSVISLRLNVRPETFSRAVAKLKPYGVTVKEDGKIVITDPVGLAKFCDIIDSRL